MSWNNDTPLAPSNPLKVSSHRPYTHKKQTEAAHVPKETLQWIPSGQKLEPIIPNGARLVWRSSGTAVENRPQLANEERASDVRS